MEEKDFRMLLSPPPPKCKILPKSSEYCGMGYRLYVYYMYTVHTVYIQMRCKIHHHRDPYELDWWLSPFFSIVLLVVSN